MKGILSVKDEDLQLLSLPITPQSIIISHFNITGT
jgi:hypothetical protein